MFTILIKLSVIACQLLLISIKQELADTRVISLAGILT